MLKKFLSGFVLIAALASCSADDPCEIDPCDVQAPPSEVQNVEAYLQANNITNAQKHCSGLYYIIDTMGTGPSIGPCSNIEATYAGYLTSGTLFDSSTVALSLAQVVRGWRVGIPQIKGGGTIRLFIPPSLGYGAASSGPIPANSILLFNVRVRQVL